MRTTIWVNKVSEENLKIIKKHYKKQKIELTTGQIIGSALIFYKEHIESKRG